MPVTAELDFTPEEIQVMLDNLDSFNEDQIIEIDRMVSELAQRKANQACYNDLLTFAKRCFPEYIIGRHHRILAKQLMSIEAGDKDRICVNMPPRHGKSMLVSTIYPAWFLGRNPTKQVMMVSHTTDLAVDFGRKVRNLVDSAAFREIFPTVSLAKDNKSAGRWNTSLGGVFYACGIGSSIAGRGADLLLIDDPHSEQDVLNGNFDVFDKAYEWFAFGARTRLMPGGRVAVIATRWHKSDLTGQLLRDMAKNPKSDQYEVVEFPAILEIENAETGLIEEKPLWPEFFDLDALLRTKASMPVFQWNAQYQQNPTAEEGSIVKREWWSRWEEDEPPEVEYIIITADTAAELKNKNDFSVFTIWGVFNNDENNSTDIIGLDMIKKRMEFPELKDLAYELYKEWEPDCFIVEKKSSGVALYQEMRRTGLPIQEFTPHRGSGDKLARLNSVADIVRSGIVWLPRTRWAEEIMEEIAEFPFGANDDIVDATTMALSRFRSGGFIRLPSDEEDEDRYFKSKRGGYY